MANGIHHSVEAGNSRRTPAHLGEQTTKVLSTLPPREEMVLRMHFGIGQRARTLEELSRQFSLTRKRVRQIEMEALRKVRERARSLYPGALITTYASHRRRPLLALQGPHISTRQP